MSPAIEVLESRIAPATIVGPRTLEYVDLDGDRVTLTISKGTLTEADFTFDTAFNNAGSQQLQVINFADDTDKSGTHVTVKVKRVGTSDGFAPIGFLNAANIDLGDVKILGDVGRIVAGDGDINTNSPGVKSLKVTSLGAMGLFTQGGAGNITSSIAGRLGALDVKGDIFEAEINAGSIGKVTVGGSLVGGSAAFSGQIFTSVEIGDVTIKGSLRGGSAHSTGQISAGGSIGKISIGGSLLGGTGGDGVGEGSGSIVSGRTLPGGITSISIGGNIEGGAGLESGSIQVGNIGTGAVGDIKVKGSVLGGVGDNSGGIFAAEDVKSVTIGGSLRGGAGDFNDNENARGQVFTNGSIGPVKIGGDIQGGPGFSGGRVHGELGIASATIGGSIIAGTGENGAGIFADLSIGKVKVGGDLDGRLFNAGSPFGIRSRDNVASVTIGGSVYGASISADDQLGAVSIKGSVFDTEIYARGQMVKSAKADIAIKSITIGGNAQSLVIRGGYETNGANNPDAQIGAVKVSGDWIASSIATGVEFNSIDGYGDGGDVKIAGDVHPEIIASIASITVKGVIIGTGAPTNDHFGFVAEQIGKFKAASTALKLKSGEINLPTNFSFSTGADVTVFEL